MSRKAFKNKMFVPYSLMVLVSLFAFTAKAQNPDLIIKNGEFYTPDGWVEAIAIKAGVIIQVGDNLSIEQSTNQATQVIDLEGATVLPGLHDMHVHPLGAGLAQFQCIFPQGSAKEQILLAVAQCVENREVGDWIVGGQWDAASFGDEPMNRQMLDEAAPNNPVSLVDISGHSIWVNSAALEIAGITNAMLNPPGGVIERNSSGEMTGVLRESAAGLVRRVTPAETPAQVKQALLWSANLMLSYGITTFTDAGVGTESLQAYAELSDEGALKQRVKICMMWSGSFFGDENNGMPDYIKLRNLYERERLSPTCIKLALDGVPTDGHTAAMLEPYENTGGLDDARAKGILMVPAEELNALVTQWDKWGFSVKLHTAGDGAVRAGLDAIAAARKTNGFSGQLHEVAHNSFVHMNDIRRARGIAATFEMSPYIWFRNPIIPDIEKAVGTERMQRWIPVKDAIEAGALVVAGSDWPVVPTVNPWIGIETLVTRKEPGGIGIPLGEAEQISLEQAVAMFTINSSKQLGNSTRTGTIAAGMLADMVVIDQNIFKIAVTDIHKTEVLMTFIQGEIVYQKP